MPEEQDFRKDFPLLGQKMNGRPLVYLDNGATTQKPESVIQSMCGYYGGCNANPHRGAYALSVEATDIYENARARVQRFIHAPSAREVIFTKNATEALNLVAYSYGLTNIGAGDEKHEADASVLKRRRAHRLERKRLAHERERQREGEALLAARGHNPLAHAAIERTSRSRIDGNRGVEDIRRTRRRARGPHG